MPTRPRVELRTALLLGIALVALVLLGVAFFASPGDAPPADDARGETQASGDGTAAPILKGHGETSDDTAAEATQTSDAPEPPKPPTWRFGMITGRIVGPDGEPVPGARASGIGRRSLYGGVEWYRSDPADEDGRFALHAMAGLATIVAVYAPGHTVTVGPNVLLPEGATKDVGTLRLVPERRLAVRVEDVQGRPVPGIEVYLESEVEPAPEGWEATLRACRVFESGTTDEQGRVGFDRLPAGTWRVRLDTEEWETGNRTREHVEADAEDVVFVVSPRDPPKSIRLEVRVLGPDGLPVPECRVNLRSADEYTSYSHQAGHKEVCELDAVTGHATLVVWGALDEQGEPLGYRPVLIRAAETLESPVVVRMEAGASITGRVVWDGEPATWTVKASGWMDPNTGACKPYDEAGEDWDWLEFPATVGADGVFLIVGLPPGRFAVSAEGPGRMDGRAPVFEAGATDVELRMVPAGTLTIHILPPKGLTFGHPYLNVRERVGEGIRGHAAWWGGGGDRPDVRIFKSEKLLPKSRYRLRAWGTCSGIDCPPVIVDDVVLREEPYVVQLEVGPHVEGVVEREDGSPVLGAEVRYIPWPGGEFDRWKTVDDRWLGLKVTDSEGAFDYGGLPDGDVLFVVTGRGLTLRDGPQRATSGTSGVRLVVVPERRISGRIEDPAGGDLGGLRVTAVPARGRPLLWTPTRVFTDGFFEVRGLAPGSYRIAAWNERDPGDTRAALSDALPAGRRDVRLQLGPAPVVQGVVKDATGRAVERATVRLRGPWTNRARQTDGEGRYTFSGVPLDVELELEVVTPTGRRVTRTLRAASTDTPTIVDVQLEKP